VRCVACTRFRHSHCADLLGCDCCGANRRRDVTATPRHASIPGVTARPGRRRKIYEREPCSIDGCLTMAKSMGLCSTHYERKRRHGDPNLVLPQGRPITTSEEVQLEVFALLERGVSQLAAARMLHLTRDKVRTIAVRRGITPQKKSGRTVRSA
jgi:hypothetical protein